MNKFIVAVIVAALAIPAFAQVPKRLPRPDSISQYLVIGSTFGSFGGLGSAGSHPVASVTVGYLKIDHNPNFSSVLYDGIELNVTYGRYEYGSLYGLSGSRLFGFRSGIDLKFCVQTAVSSDYKVWTNGFGPGVRYHMNRWIAAEVNMFPLGFGRRFDLSNANFGVIVTL